MDFMNCKNPVSGGFVDRFQKQVHAARDRRFNSLGDRVRVGQDRINREQARERETAGVVKGLHNLAFRITCEKARIREQAEMDAFLPGWSVPPRPYTWVEVSKTWYQGEVIATHEYVHGQDIPLCGECGFDHEDDSDCEHDINGLFA